MPGALSSKSEGIITSDGSSQVAQKATYHPGLSQPEHHRERPHRLPIHGTRNIVNTAKATEGLRWDLAQHPWAEHFLTKEGKRWTSPSVQLA